MKLIEEMQVLYSSKKKNKQYREAVNALFERFKKNYVHDAERKSDKMK